MRIVSRRAVRLSLLIAALAATTVVAPAAGNAATPTSAAASCPDYVMPGGPTATADVIYKDKAAVHSGPAAACRVTDHVAYNTTVYKWCSWFNVATGNWWNYTNWGWIYAGYFKAGVDDSICDEW